MLPVRSRRWFAGVAALAATTPMLAVAQIKDVPRDDDEDSDNSYTSPEYGMDVTWEAPWELAKVTESADRGFESVKFQPTGMNSDYLSIYTSLISANFDSSEEYLDHYEEAYDPSKIESLRNHTDGVHYLINERTETTLTVMFFFNTGQGSVFELYEHHAEPDADYATRTILMVNSSEIFVGHFKDVQKYITLNGDIPFTTTDDDDVIDLATDALDGVYPDDRGSRSGNQRDEDEDEDEDDEAGDDVLEEIRDHFDDLEPTVDEFLELMQIRSLSQDEADRANTILGMWLDAPEIAASVDLPRSQSDLEDAYNDYTVNLALGANGVIAAISEDSSQTVAQAGVEAFEDAMAANADLAETLDDLLAEYGV